jgi:hypothetical protein
MVAERDEAPVVGIFGAGRFGLAVARLALDAGYRVRIASSGPIETTADAVRGGAPGAVATSAADLVAGTDLVILAVPLRRFRELPLASFAGHVVVDTMNYWPPVDGVLAEFEQSGQPTSVVVRDALPPTARVVKTLNHLGYHQVERFARPGGGPGRTAIAITGDDAEAVLLASKLVERLGFDSVHAGALRASAALQPEAAIFGRNLDAASMRHLVSGPFVEGDLIPAGVGEGEGAAERPVDRNRT